MAGVRYFSGLDPGKKYEIVARVQETDTSGVSAASEALTVTTEKSQVEAPKKPELESVTSTAIKGKDCGRPGVFHRRRKDLAEIRELHWAERREEL